MNRGWNIYALSYCLDEDYPAIKGPRAMSELWLEVDGRKKAGLPFADLLDQIAYKLKVRKRWPLVDCLSMVPGIGVSARARKVLEELGVPGMQFLRFHVNNEPFYLFYTERCLDCLDHARAEIECFAGTARTRRVHRFAFKEGCLQPCDVFTLPELSDGMFFWCQETFFTAAARDKFEKAGLVGFRFEDLPS
ncbi:MAG: DUF1629 domain-containing protein [Gemmataceae bacterium]